MHKRFERGDRFAEVHVDDRTVTTRAGKLGSDGKTTARKLRTAGHAEAEGRKLVLGYRKNNWTVVTLEPVPCAPAAAFPREPKLEASLHDGDTYQVYADWLQSHGSPLGELIVLQTPPLTAAKKRRADAIIATLGMPAPDHATASWVRGFWHGLRIENSRDWMDGDFDAVHLARGLFGAPMCAALHQLSIGVLRWEYLGDVEAVIDEAGKHAWSKQLYRLDLGDVSGDIDMAHHVIGDVGKRISKAFPNLRILTLHSGEQNWHGRESFGLKGLALPHLTHLTIETCSLSKARCKAVVTAPLPALERLELWFGAANYGATATVRDLAPLLAGTAFPRLTRLALRNAEIADDLARALPGAAIASRLTELDLSMGTLSDEGAAFLAAHARSFPKLQVLDVSDNFLTAKPITALKKAFRKVVSTEQKDIDGDWRYVTVAE